VLSFSKLFDRHSSEDNIRIKESNKYVDICSVGKGRGKFKNKESIRKQREIVDKIFLSAQDRVEQ